MLARVNYIHDSDSLTGSRIMCYLWEIDDKMTCVSGDTEDSLCVPMPFVCLGGYM